jgi:hypothetical protein
MKLLALIAPMMIAVALHGTDAKASDADWKLYGTSTVHGYEDLCFFDMKGAVEGADKRIKVWTKCLHKEAMDAIDIKKDFDGKIMDNAARKVLARYIPPIALVEDVNFDQATSFVMFEEIADVANVQPAARILYELDCSQQMLRELSIEIDADGKSGSKHTANEWKYVPPETNGARLLKILCEKSIIR